MATTTYASTVIVPNRHAALPELARLNTAATKAIPNKHIPYCSPGPRPLHRQPELSPATPLQSVNQSLGCPSLLYPPHEYNLLSNEPPVYAISATELAEAIRHVSSQPLPPPEKVFPWIHGLHAENQMQLAFFTARKKALGRPPKCIRGLTIVKAGGDLTHSTIKGAIGPEEILQVPSSTMSNSNALSAEFLEIDPREGFSVRNFQIQACKLATVSDVIVYGDSDTSRDQVETTARHISIAQASWQKKVEGTHANRLFNTYIVTDAFDTIETTEPEIVALDSHGETTGHVMDFFHWERVEMCSMSKPTQISHNVWLGSTPDASLELDSMSSTDFDLMVETSDVAQMPDADTLLIMDELLARRDRAELDRNAIPQLEFPGSGSILPPTWSHAEVDGLLATCEWIYRQAHSDDKVRARRDSKVFQDSDQQMSFHEQRSESSGRRVLIHCADGYTETSLLALAYYMYAERKSAHEAWIDLHTQKRRNFFAYGSDVALLRAIEPRLLQASPHHSGNVQDLCVKTPAWFDHMDGSLPSRVLDYMYLGNIGHANNPALLEELGIGQVLSVGEPLTWPKETARLWSKENLLFVDRVQDNGVDPLTNEFARCLEFIEKGRKKGTATLVHCRVGVSRSATICIAEVMRAKGLSFPRAYCFVRARRLNVIIQPHLRFSYELLKWEEQQCQQRGSPLKRELEWATIAREIAAMNKPYSR